MKPDALFEPARINKLALPNRIVMAPMTRYFSPAGVPTEDVAAYYRRRAERGVGLIISEGTGIARAPSLNGGPGLPRFFGDDSLGGWKDVVTQVHHEGGRMAPQLWHTGATHAPFPDWEPPAPWESPSGHTAPNEPLGRPMTEEDVADTIAAFAQGAADARALGFDAVEFHGAHGYLIDQFFWKGTNSRTDRWGGETIAERARFAAEMIKSARAAVGPDFPIILRISQWKQQDFGAKLAETPEEMSAWLSPLAEAGVDAFHCSQRRFWESEFEGSDLNFAGWVKKITGKVTITVGSVGLTGEFLRDDRSLSDRSEPASLDELVRRLERGDFDLVAVGRAILQDPDWVTKVREGRNHELIPFTKEALGSLY